MISDHTEFKREIRGEIRSVISVQSMMIDIVEHGDEFGRLSRSKAAKVAENLRNIATEIDLAAATFAASVGKEE